MAIKGRNMYSSSIAIKYTLIDIVIFDYLPFSITGNWKVHYLVTKKHETIPVLSQINSLYICKTCILITHINIIPNINLFISSNLLSSGLQAKTFYIVFVYPVCLICPSHVILLNLTKQTCSVLWRQELWSPLWFYPVSHLLCRKSRSSRVALFSNTMGVFLFLRREAKLTEKGK